MFKNKDLQDQDAELVLSYMKTKILNKEYLVEIDYINGCKI